jgi:hypothetical protein
MVRLQFPANTDFASENGRSPLTMLLTDEFVQQNSTITVEGVPPNKMWCVTLRLVTGPRKLYAYFPFFVEVSSSSKRVSLILFEKEFQQLSVMLPDVESDLNGVFTIDTRSEVSGIPSKLELGPDSRNLVCLLKSVSLIESDRDRPLMPRHLARPGRAGQFSNEPGPIFVLGSYRSGTSILTWAVGQHPNIAPLEETNWLQPTLLGSLAGFRLASQATLNAPQEYRLDASEYLRWIGLGINEMHRTISRDRGVADFVGRLAGKNERYDPRFQRLHSIWSEKRRWVDGTPEHCGIALLLAKAFPTARFLITLRNPREVVASLMSFRKVGGAQFTLDQAVEHWLKFTQLTLKLMDHLPAEFTRLVHHSAIATAPLRELREIFDFLHEPWFDQAVRTYEVRINSSRTNPVDLDVVTGPAIDRALDIYDQISRGAKGLEIDWGAHNLGSLEELNNDWASRILTSLGM